jgi:hypothetical protein
MAAARLACAIFLACALAAGCGTSPCGLKLQQHLFLPQTSGGQQGNIELPCCGGSVFRDIDLNNAGDVEIDLTNPNGSGVDGFLTNIGCDKLFDGPYTGAETAALCQVHMGPVRPRAVSERKKLAAGRYRIFAQGYAANDAALSISLDLGVWSAACRWNPIAP